MKLEVGKTYRSRKGEEVKIVRKVNATDYPYQGSNNECYTESGKWSYYSYTEEHPKDLIEEVEEVPETRHTFAIPDGVKEITLSHEGNRIVVEMVPEKEPKPGDVPEIDRIREWMKGRVPDGYYTYQGIAYVIENYLKYREGEK